MMLTESEVEHAYPIAVRLQQRMDRCECRHPLPEAGFVECERCFSDRHLLHDLGFDLDHLAQVAREEK